jgi:hypothetical protein
MRGVQKPKLSRLPRMWLPKNASVAVGETLPSLDGTLAAAAVAPIGRHAFPGGVRAVISTRDELTLVLRNGPQIRIGGIGDLRLKLAIARRILRLAAAASAVYIDVSVPGRPVLGQANPQVASGG